MPLSITAKLGIVAAVTAIIGGALTVANQAQVAEPMWVATRSFVRDQVTQQQSYITQQLQPIERKQNQMEADALRALRDSTRDKMFDIDLLLKKETDPDVHRNIERQKQELQDRLDLIQQKLNSLQR